MFRAFVFSFQLRKSGFYVSGRSSGHGPFRTIVYGLPPVIIIRYKHNSTSKASCCHFAKRRVIEIGIFFPQLPRTFTKYRYELLCYYIICSVLGNRLQYQTSWCCERRPTVFREKREPGNKYAIKNTKIMVLVS